MTWRIFSFALLAWAQNEPFFQSTGFLYLNRAQYEAAAMAFAYHQKQTSNERLKALFVAGEIYAHLRAGNETLAQQKIASLTKQKKFLPAHREFWQLLYHWLQGKPYPWQKIFTDTTWFRSYPYTTGWLLLESAPSDSVFIQVLHQLRKVSSQPLLYTERLFPLYEKLGLYREALKELIMRYEQGYPGDPVNVLREKMLQWVTLLADPYVLEKPLLQAHARNPQDPTYLSWLVDFYLAVGDYAQALIQAKALLRQPSTYFSCSDFLGIVEELLARAQYTWAQEGVEFLLRQDVSCSQKEQVFEKWLFLQRLTTSPAQVIRRIDSLMPYYQETAYLLLEKARWLLRAGEIPQASQILQNLTSLPTALVPQKELLISDILILEANYLEARLHLLELENRYPNSYWAYLTNFKLAELAYYQGEFDLAQARLRILKDNVFSDLSNDAIQLYWLIEDNLQPDTLTEPLQLFAMAQLYFLRGYMEKSLHYLDSTEARFKGHPITDDIFWHKYQIYRQLHDTLAMTVYLKLLADYPGETLYLDDALFQLGLLLWEKNRAQAIAYWERLVETVPTSLYVRLVRQRLDSMQR
ncbi:MAG: tetratricopeptide repeat protein [Bacteroidia bacterium]